MKASILVAVPLLVLTACAQTNVAPTSVPSTPPVVAESTDASTSSTAGVPEESSPPESPAVEAPVEAPAPPSGPEGDVTGTASTFVSGLLEVGSLNDACLQGLSWVCHVDAINRAGDTVTVTLGQVGADDLATVASSWRSFLVRDDSPTRGITTVVARHGSETATSKG